MDVYLISIDDTTSADALPQNIIVQMCSYDNNYGMIISNNQGIPLTSLILADDTIYVNAAEIITSMLAYENNDVENIQDYTAENLLASWNINTDWLYITEEELQQYTGSTEPLSFRNILEKLRNTYDTTITALETNFESIPITTTEVNNIYSCRYSLNGLNFEEFNTAAESFITNGMPAIKASIPSVLSELITLPDNAQMLYAINNMKTSRAPLEIIISQVENDKYPHTVYFSTSQTFENNTHKNITIEIARSEDIGEETVAKYTTAPEAATPFMRLLEHAEISISEQQTKQQSEQTTQTDAS